jgi:hypothetical protein
LVKALVEVLHEVTGIKLIVGTSHSQKLMTGKKIHKRPHQTIHKILDMRARPLTLCPSWVGCPASLQKNKLWRWHLDSADLYVMKTRRTRHTIVVSQGMA